MYIPLDLSIKLQTSSSDARLEFFSLAEELVAYHFNGVVTNEDGSEDTQFYDVMCPWKIISVKSSLSAKTHAGVLRQSLHKRSSIIYGLQYSKSISSTPFICSVKKSSEDPSKIEIGKWRFTCSDVNVIQDMPLGYQGRLNCSNLWKIVELEEVIELKLHPKSKKYLSVLEKINNLTKFEEGEDFLDWIESAIEGYEKDK